MTRLDGFNQAAAAGAGAGANVTSGDGAPSSTPSNLGDIYIDVTNDRMYFAADTSGSGDWKEVLST
jgi:hypothetical protein